VGRLSHILPYGRHILRWHQDLEGASSLKRCTQIQAFSQQDPLKQGCFSKIQMKTAANISSASFCESLGGELTNNSTLTLNFGWSVSLGALSRQLFRRCSFCRLLLSTEYARTTHCNVKVIAITLPLGSALFQV
jgi:hypothetical protein